MSDLQVNNIHLRYQSKAVVRGASLSLASGQVGVIVGANGCGKSTLLKAIAKLHPLDEGQIVLNGRNTRLMSNQQMARQVSLLPQSANAPEGMTVGMLVRYGRYPYQGLFRSWSKTDDLAVRLSMDKLGVLEFENRRLDELSGGQRQRCWLAMILAQDTPLVLLDEPTSMLDLGHQIEVLEQIKGLAQMGKSVLLVLHDLALAVRYADQIFAMNEGQIICSGTAQEIVTAELIKMLYGVDADIMYTPDHMPLVVPQRLALIQ
ncbi:putative siderophore transport system ATP-binding protein YusV [Ephemeroptericola cinctiostellae]|uniref:Putative siderophore transport system ATP-binding protein YusV n=1 Tax=Ephemeroptericola cinctiostellae TaxID=2268024 RepID=A0A345DB66_9BURK|nr:ABC transporter ATP-binding protein [Ephemeroptericola cinctiostellae]AXF85604.1 putative siderophore transport system ATP-binding protein YusV [Ephemeroptericola cinctiostellae]